MHNLFEEKHQMQYASCATEGESGIPKKVIRIVADVVISVVSIAVDKEVAE